MTQRSLHFNAKRGPNSMATHAKYVNCACSSATLQFLRRTPQAEEAHLLHIPALAQIPRPARRVKEVETPDTPQGWTFGVLHSPSSLFGFIDLQAVPFESLITTDK